MIWRTIAPILVLIIGVGLVYGIWVTRPRAKKSSPTTLAPQVEVFSSTIKSQQVTLDALGVVKPSHLANIQSEVSGKIEYVHPQLVEGGLVKTDDVLVRIDRTNYQIALTQQKANLARAQFELDMELGRKKVAEKEWELLGKESSKDGIDKKLALREPHLAAAQAAVRSAQAAVRKAVVDLRNTEVKAPFDSLVLSKNVELGQIATPQVALATLVSTDHFWVQVAVPTSELPFIELPDPTTGEGGSKAVLLASAEKNQRRIEGKVTRLLGSLSDRGKMARLIVEVSDPLGLNQSNKNSAPLLLEDFVTIQILGMVLNDVHAIPRHALRDGNHVWIVQDKKLVSVPIKVVWRGKDQVFVQGDLGSQVQVIESRLRTPVEGMHVRVGDLDRVDPSKL